MEHGLRRSEEKKERRKDERRGTSERERGRRTRTRIRIQVILDVVRRWVLRRAAVDVGVPLALIHADIVDTHGRGEGHRLEVEVLPVLCWMGGGPSTTMSNEKRNQKISGKEGMW